MNESNSGKPVNKADIPDVNTMHWLEYVFYFGLILILLVSLSFDIVDVFELM